MLAKVAVAQIGMSIDLQNYKIRVTGGERADGTRREGVLAAKHKWKGAARYNGVHDLRKLVERRRHARNDVAGLKRCDAEIAVRLAPELLVKKLKLLARGKDRSRPPCGSGTVADRGLQAEGDHNGARLFRTVHTIPCRVLKAILRLGEA